jgi:hypothetical protein
MWHYNTFVTPQVFQFIGPSNDGRRHGRGTYLLVSNLPFLQPLWCSSSWRSYRRCPFCSRCPCSFSNLEIRHSSKIRPTRLASLLLTSPAVRKWLSLQFLFLLSLSLSIFFIYLSLSCFTQYPQTIWQIVDLFKIFTLCLSLAEHSPVMLLLLMSCVPLRLLPDKTVSLSLFVSPANDTI